jgi:hypothetical protein
MPGLREGPQTGDTDPWMGRAAERGGLDEVAAAVRQHLLQGSGRGASDREGPGGNGIGLGGAKYSGLRGPHGTVRMADVCRRKKNGPRLLTISRYVSVSSFYST